MAAFLIVVLVIVVAAVILVQRGALPPPSAWGRPAPTARSAPGRRPDGVEPIRPAARDREVPHTEPAGEYADESDDAWAEEFEDEHEDEDEDEDEFDDEDEHEAVLQGAVEEWPPEPVAATEEVVWDDVEVLTHPEDEPVLEPAAVRDRGADAELARAEASEAALVAEAMAEVPDGSILAQRTPKASGVPSRPMRLGEASARPVPQSRRSPNEVRSLLSNYRSGLQKGRDSEDLE